MNEEILQNMSSTLTYLAKYYGKDWDKAEKMEILMDLQMCAIKTGVFKGFEYGCFLLDKYVTISCIVWKNLDEKIYILSKKLP